MMRSKSRILFLLLLVTIITSCSVRRQHALFNAPSDIVTDTIKQVYVVNDQGISDSYYKIKVNDLLAVKNLQDREFGANVGATNIGSNAQGGTTQNTLSYLVDTDGTVNLPAIGKVEVVGLSRRDAAIKIQEIYQKKLLKDPIIQLSIVNLKVTLLGEFGRQGNFLLERENTTLIDIIGEAGGVNKSADPKTCKIIRGDRSNPEIIYVNLNDINSLASKKLVLQNNDIVVIQQTKNAAITERLNSLNNIIQPILVVVNLAVLILTVTR